MNAPHPHPPTVRAYLFLKRSGRCPLEDYLRTINVKAEIAHIHAMIERLIEQQGFLPFPYAKKVREKIWELRSPLGNRVFYVMVTGREIILLDGYTKKRDRIEPHVLDRIWNLYHEYLSHKLRKPYQPESPLHKLSL